MALKDWVSPGMTSVRPCSGQFYQHSSGANVFYDDFGYCTPQYELPPASITTAVVDTGMSWITIAVLAVGGYLVWHYRKQIFG
jgi:hypothetical protein